MDSQIELKFRESLRKNVVDKKSTSPEIRTSFNKSIDKEKRAN